jgi:subtilisin family serine protease
VRYLNCWFAAGLAIPVLLIACGGGDSPPPQDGTTPLQMQGSVVGSTSSTSRVYLDLNGNQSQDPGEPMTAVADDGSFSMNLGARSQAELSSSTLVADGGSSSTGVPLTAPVSAFVSMDESGRQQVSAAVISPVTSLVSAEVTWNGSTPQQAAQAVQNDLGIANADLFSDYVRHPEPQLTRAAGAAMQILQAAHAASNAPREVAAAIVHGKRANQKSPTPNVSGSNRFVVLMSPDAVDPQGMANAVAARHGGHVHHVFSNIAKGFAVSVPASNVADFLEQTSQEASVERIEEDRVVTAQSAVQTDAPWVLDRIDQRSLPLNGTYTYNATGSRVTAYIVDTGIRATHVEFTRRVQAGFTAFADSFKTSDCNGHGTHVAGIVGGATFGVAKAVLLVPVRVLDCSGNGYASTVAAGLDWIVAHRSPRTPAVAVLSFESYESTIINAAIGRLIASGVTVVAAAGNDGDNACNYSPASAPGVLAVGATDRNDQRISFSNAGLCLGVFAPGMDVKSAWWSFDTATAELTGTSMAAAATGGVAALYLQTNPAASPAQVISAIKNAATIGQVSDARSGPVDTLLYTDLASTSPIPLPPISAPISTPISGPVPPISLPSTAPTLPVSGTDAVDSLPRSMSVGALSGAGVVSSSKAWQASVTVAVQDEWHASVAGATVTGTFSAGGSKLTCVTSWNGTCTITGGLLPLKTSSVKFTINSLVKSGTPYVAAQNIVSTLTVSRPAI